MFQAFLTILSSGFKRYWLLLTKVADFSYPLNATGEFHVLKQFSVLSHGTYNAGSLKPSVDVNAIKCYFMLVSYPPYVTNTVPHILILSLIQ